MLIGIYSLFYSSLWHKQILNYIANVLIMYYIFLINYKLTKNNWRKIKNIYFLIKIVTSLCFMDFYELFYCFFLILFLFHNIKILMYHRLIFFNLFLRNILLNKSCISTFWEFHSSLQDFKMVSRSLGRLSGSSLDSCYKFQTKFEISLKFCITQS